MWTPRRIGYMLLGFLAFGIVYAGYNRVLGSFDGLPPLPTDYKRERDSNAPITRPTGVNALDQKLEMAFGPNCRELRLPIKLEMRAKMTVIAAEKFTIIKSGPREGWVELSPLSVAIFGKKRGPDGIPEINKIYCDIAYIQFDQPIRSMNDLEGKKAVFAELQANADELSPDSRKGRILLGNNRRTLDDNDDIEFLTPGPLYYVDEPKPGKPHIYTTNAIQVTDHQNTQLVKPDRKSPRVPTVTGVGMRVFLAREEPAKKNPPPKIDPKTAFARKKDDKQPGISGVDIIELDSTVEINLWTDSSASLTSPATPPPTPPTPKKVEPAPKKDALIALPSPKKLLQIKTNGPFRYDMVKELAHFEKPAVQKPGVVEHVTMTRDGRTVGQDMLDCEYLDIFFQRKRATPPKPGAIVPKKEEASTGSGDLEIKTLHAWGEIVVLTSDSENLKAHGVDLNHDAEQRTTILKGSADMKVQVVKDGNLLHGSELHLFGDSKDFSQAHVLGPGSVGMGDIDRKTNSFTKQATWVDRLVFTKQVEKDRTIDVLTFIGKPGVGKATFRDTSAPEVQHLEGYQLKVWLLPNDAKDKKTPTPKKDGNADGLRGSRPQRLEATGDVKSFSAEVIIRQADYLNVWFQDVPQLTKPKEPAAQAKTPMGPPKDVLPPTPVVKGELPPNPKDVVAPKPKDKAEPKQPMFVRAKTLETWINRDPSGSTEVDRVHAEGDVEVHQDGTKENPQGTDVGGTILDLKTYADGNYLHVQGDPITKPNPGYVSREKLKMFGPDIIIDQRTNTSNIKGEGSMEILSASNLDGKKLDKPTVMTVYWKHKMEFFGTDKLIYYHGAVQAYQEASRVRCEWMQIVLDRPVYLNQAMKPKTDVKTPGDSESAKVDTVLCFHAPKDDDVPRPKVLQPVTIIEETKENNRTVKFQQIQAPEVVSVTTPGQGEPKKDTHTLTATSAETMPGVVRLWQAGAKDTFLTTKDPGPPKKGPAPKKGDLAADEEMKLTVVQFSEKMLANDLRKRAKFFGNIRVVHLPADRHTLPVDLREGDVPKGAIFLMCRRSLEVSTKNQIEKDAQGREIEVGYQEMEAEGNVRVRKQGEFFGDADKVTYSELKGVLTFYGSKMNPAVVHQQRGQGVKDKVIESEKIYYYTKTKTFQLANGTTLTD